jgi:CheY-like chemotaxis protein
MQRRALLVEDDEAVRQVLSAFLQIDGIGVIEAVDGMDGLERACADCPDLVVTDIMMPRMDGITLLHRLREHDASRSVPVLLISGHSDPPVPIESTIGPVGFVNKPVSLGNFLAEVKRLLAAA